MAFSKCPECGETNFEEDYYGYRTFDCGFRSESSRRVARCGSPLRSSPPPISIPHEVARYRLALLDAAQAADAIAADMTDQGHADEFPGRCRELSRQMREFAGHATGETVFQDSATRGKWAGTGTALMTIFRKARPW